MVVMDYLKEEKYNKELIIMPEGIGYEKGVGIAEYKDIQDMEGYYENSEDKQNREVDEQQDISAED